MNAGSREMTICFFDVHCKTVRRPTTKSWIILEQFNLSYAKRIQVLDCTLHEIRCLVVSKGLSIRGGTYLN